MKTFITISKRVRDKYHNDIPIIAAMCKMPQREDVILYLNKYQEFKLANK